MIKYFIIYFHFYSQGNIGCAKVNYAEYGYDKPIYSNKIEMANKIIHSFKWAKTTVSIDSIVETSEYKALKYTNNFETKIEWSLTDNN